ncbi:hypothetical protein CHS0354_035045 [Potamilus streckersoni]|uniref:Peptide-methionine (R)-S-oxide reductase n=1 Tax=Potamilus streckersoni TaxID=2493646 RepID=A0AAE0VU21_9BIVA|nr:hypothetical protein CHS0354_035045 [Potamilus streckersoni]
MRSNTWLLVFFLVAWMNILHLVSAKKEESPVIKKLKESCKESGTCPVTYPKEDLKERLTPVQYRVTQEKGTERPFSGKYVDWRQEGVYTCVVCGNKLFSSDTKFDSSCGWPSFSDVMNSKSITLVDDTSHGMSRVEVTCSYCGAHLGHVFKDGPPPTGLRYCINSAAVNFISSNEIENLKNSQLSVESESHEMQPKIKSEL